MIFAENQSSFFTFLIPLLILVGGILTVFTAILVVAWGFSFVAVQLSKMDSWLKAHGIDMSEAMTETKGTEEAEVEEAEEVEAEVAEEAEIPEDSHYNYLERISTGDDAVITRETAKQAWSVWLALKKVIGTDLPVPSACNSADGDMFYCWDNNEHHFEITIYHSGSVDCFYRNRKTRRLWSDEWPNDIVPTEVITLLSLCVPGPKEEEANEQ